MRSCFTLVLLLSLVLLGGCNNKGVPILGMGPRKVALPPPPVVAAPPTVVVVPDVAVGEPPALPEAKPAAAANSSGEAAPAAETSPPAAKPAAEAAPAAEAKPAKVETLYEDTFADLKGGLKKNADGKTKQEVPGISRQVHMFRAMPEDGTLVMQVLEDPATKGPDGEPGVLALSWQEVPAKLQYCGWVYLGRNPAPQRMTLPPLQVVKAAEELQAYHLSFKYRGVNTKAKAADPQRPDESETPKEPVKIPISWRLEPALPDSYNKRLDVGKFTATEEWTTIDVCLKEGTNTAAFLKAIADEHPTGFKIVWAQGGLINAYHAGDTLLIDDIKVTRSAK